VSRSVPQTATWQERTRGFFLPLIRARGERYAWQRRVSFDVLSQDHLAATVRGTRPYAVTVSRGDGLQAGVVFACTCPFFRGGHRCKHLWAVIMEADRLLAETTDSFGQMYAPARARGAAAGSSGWQTLLRHGDWAAGAPFPAREAGTGRFTVFYQLDINPRGVRVSARERYVRKNGLPGRSRRLQAATVEDRGLPRVDRLIIAVMDDIRRRRFGGYISCAPVPRGLENLLVEPRDLDLLLSLLVETRRCRVCLGSGAVIADPLRQGSAPEAALMLKAEGNPAGDGCYRLRPAVLLEGGGREVRLHEIPVFFQTAPVLFVWDGGLYSLPGPSFSVVRRLAELQDVPLPGEELRELAVMAESIAMGPKIALPESVAPGEAVDAVPVPVLMVSVRDGTLRGQVFMDYDGIEVEWADPRPSFLDMDRWIRIFRRPQDEAAHTERLRRNGFQEREDGFDHAMEGAADAIHELAEAGWRVVGQDRKAFRAGSVSRLSVSSGIDWFDLEGDVTFGDMAVSLPRAVRAFLRGERFVTLADGSLGLLPETWLAKHRTALELSSSQAGRGSREELRFSPAQALSLDAVLEGGAVGSLDSRFREIRDALRGFSGIEAVPVDRGFAGALRPYQIESLGWFDFLKKFGFGGVLADDMGLGKTVQVLAWLAGERSRQSGAPSMVVAPTSLLFNWRTEAERFVPGLKVLVYAGQERSVLWPRMGETDLVLASYGVVRRDIGVLQERGFHYLILDESQAIKNPDSQIARAVRQIKARHRLCLTGTPVENHAGEIWSQMQFLNPGLLGPRAFFDREYTRPLNRGEEKAGDALRLMIRPFVLRRTKEAVAPELPEKVEHMIRCPMTEDQARVYAQVRDYYRASVLSAVDRHGIGRSRIKALEGLLRLRQAANHPALIGEEAAGSGKLDELMTLLQEATAGGHKALVFSQFTRMLGLVRSALDRALRAGNIACSYEYLDGRTPRAAREAKVRRFQETEDVRLFLISLKAGGTGLNLTAADYVFLVDPWWNPAVEIQAVDRTHRIGQVRKVFTYRLISRDTVEEKVLQLQEKKRTLVGAILSGGQEMLRDLTRQDLEVLFS